MKNVSILIFGLLFNSLQGIKPVQSVNLLAYLGHWFEVGSSLTVREQIEKDGFCQLASYTLKDNGVVEVINRQRKGSNEGEFRFMRGYVTQDNVKAPGKLSIDFGYQKKRQYWIYALGPIINGEYQWSVVSDPNQNYMWVMARSPEVYSLLFEDIVRKSPIIKELGFDKQGREYIPRSYQGCNAYQF